MVKAAKEALETGNVNYLLPWVPADAEAELSHGFVKALAARTPGGAAKDVADLLPVKY